MPANFPAPTRRGADAQVVLAALFALVLAMFLIGERDGVRHIGPHMWKSALWLVRQSGEAEYVAISP